MKIRRRTKVVSETKRSFTISIARKKVRFFCPQCDAQTEMFTLNEAARHSNKNWREIVRAIKNGELHSSETGNGEIFICARSLSD